MTRPDWDKYFITIAMDVSARSTCPRARVGAVIVRDNKIISTGYNGAPAGKPHCEDVGCDVVDGHCQRAMHAEINAVLFALDNGVSLKGATLYYWDSQGRYAQTMEDFKSQFPEQGKLIEAVGVSRVCGRGL